MPYRYVAYDAAGKEIRGVLQVEREETAERLLFDRGLTVAKLARIPDAFNLASIFPTFFGPRTRDVIVFFKSVGKPG